MPNNLLENLPRIIAEGQQEAQCALARFTGDGPGLQTMEWVFPAAGIDPYSPRRHAPHRIQPNRLIQGDSLSVAAALLAGDAHGPSLRGQIGLILIDPELDAKDAGGGMASYLATITPRLILMRELLNQAGSIYIRLNEGGNPYAAAIVEKLFGCGVRVHVCTGNAARPPNSTIEAIILVSTDPHMIVADFFGGIGRAAIAAAQYGRRWIAVDGSGADCTAMRKSLSRFSTEPFLYQTMPDTS
jgi:hypothetical protein